MILFCGAQRITRFRDSTDILHTRLKAERVRRKKAGSRLEPITIISPDYPVKEVATLSSRNSRRASTKDWQSVVQAPLLTETSDAPDGQGAPSENTACI